MRAEVSDYITCELNDSDDGEKMRRENFRSLSHVIHKSAL
jgi:hypothetical protein